MGSRPAVVLSLFVLALILVAGAVAAPALAAEPALDWNTFLGGDGQFDHAKAVAVDAGGNIYVAGKSDASWGSPVRAYAGEDDAFVAKLSPSGALLWHSFLGGAGQDFGEAVAVDSAGGVYVAGYSYESWGAPARAFADGSWGDAFVAKVSASGALLWNTFLGADDQDEAHALVVGAGGAVVVAGFTDGSGWGDPIRPYDGGYDTFVAGLSTSDGSLTWNTFLDGGLDYGFGLAAGDDGSLYVTGTSNYDWGDPVRPHLGGSWVYSAQVAKLASTGALVWNTFLGEDVDPGDSAYCHYGKEIAVDAAGNVYVLGLSDHTWGDPVRPHPGVYDVTTFVARLESNGALAWNTFLYGGNDEQDATALAVDGAGNVLAAGSSGPWGNPVEPYHGGSEASLAQLSPAGALAWNTFVGGAGHEHAEAIAVGPGGAIALAGYGSGTWGAPVRPFTVSWDAFVAKVALVETLPTNIALTSASATLVKYGAAYTLRGVLESEGSPLEGRTVTLQKAPAASGPWGDTAVTANTAADGSFALRHVPRSKTFYRARFTAAAGYRTATSEARFALPRAWVGNPAAPSVMYKGKAATVKSTLKPRHTAGAFPVRIYKYRYVSGKWKSYGYVKAKASNYSSYTRVSCSVRLPYAGRWRLRALHPADGGHAKSWSSGYDSVTVK